MLAHRARQLLHREIEFTHHVSLPCVVVELKMNTNYINLAKIVHAFASAGTLSQHVSIHRLLVYSLCTCVISIYKIINSL